jgi:hypothetical protein
MLRLHPGGTHQGPRHAMDETIPALVAAIALAAVHVFAGRPPSPAAPPPMPCYCGSIDPAGTPPPGSGRRRRRRDEILSRSPGEIGTLILQVPGSTANTRMPLLRRRSPGSSSPRFYSALTRPARKASPSSPTTAGALRPRGQAGGHAVSVGCRSELHAPRLGAALRRCLAAASARQAPVRPSGDTGPRTRDLRPN